MNNPDLERELILEMDLGNTAGKWRLLGSNGVFGRGVHDYESGFSSLFDSVSDELHSAHQEIVGCRVVSVAGATVNHQLMESWKKYSSSPLRFAAVSPELGGVRCGYKDIGQMGIDRWAAVLAASRITQERCIVIDAGTALTLDVLDERNQHLGGYIFPGVGLSIESLKNHTAIPNERIPDFDNVTKAGEDSFRPGASTQDAILGALALAYRGYIEGAMSAGGNPSAIVITGGHCGYLEKLVASIGLVGVQVLVVEELVLDGLSLLVPIAEVA